MENKLITVWNSEPGAGRETVVRTMATCLSQQGKTVLVATPGSNSSDQHAGVDPAVWVPRFKALSPLMLRNYLARFSTPFAQVALPADLPAAVLKDLLALIKAAFEWTFWLAADDVSEPSLLALDASDLLILVALPGETSRESLRAQTARLAAHHFPNSLYQVVLNQVPAALIQNLKEADILPGKKPLAGLPLEGTQDVHFIEAVREAARLLQDRDELYARQASRQSLSRKPAEQAVQDLKARIQPELLEAMEHHIPAEEAAQKTLASCLAEDATVSASREERKEIYSRVLNEVLGLGPMEPLLRDSDISEIMVNGKDSIFVEKKGKLHPSGVHFSSDAQLRTVIDRIVAPLGRRVDESMPLCDARLADGSRVNIVLPPLALDGAVVTIRKFAAKALDFLELIRLGSVSAAMADFLRACVRLRKNIVVAGGTGSGKTTLLNALSSLIPEDERIVTIEDAAELRLQKPHVVRLESRPPNAEGEGAIPIRRLVINALRMRPDRIVVGECRGGEALDMLQAMNTGHDGSLTTVHANSPRDALSRLETLALMAGMELPVRVVREQIRSAVDLIIQQSRLPDGSRKVVSLTEVTGMEGDTLTTQEIFRFRNGQFENTGIVPSFAEEMRRAGCGF